MRKIGELQAVLPKEREEMKGLAKTLAALLASLAAVFATLGLAGTALAQDYGTVAGTVTDNGISIHVTFNLNNAGRQLAIAKKSVFVQFDNSQAATVVEASLVGPKYVGELKGDSIAFSVTRATGYTGPVTLTVFLGTSPKDPNPVSVGSTTVPAAPNTGSGQNAAAAGATSGNNLPQTGAAILPYLIAVVLLAAVGLTILIVRNNNKANGR